MTTDTKSLLLFFILLSSIASAQLPQAKKMEIDTSNKSQLIKKSNWEGGLLLGGTVYTGDLEWALPESRPIFGLFIRRAMGNYFAFNARLSQGFLSGSDSHSTETDWRVARNIGFKSSLTELSVRGEFHFLGNTRKVLEVKSVMDETSAQTYKRRARLISPFVYVGGGVALLRPKTNFNDSPLPNPIIDAARIAADKSAKFSKIIPIIPFGGGLRIPWVNKQAYFTIEGGFRPTFSDYVDGVSIAGNTHVNDWYFVGDIGLSKLLGNKKDSDGDGIADKQDLCPFMKGDLKLHGCPDSDGDGISDDKDACSRVAGLTIYEGCPDTDGDGVIDKYDDCPTIVGLGQFKGCPSEKVTRDSTGHIVSYGLDTVKTIVESDNTPLKSVDISKPSAQNDSLSLGGNPSNPVAIPPQYAAEKKTEKTDEPQKEPTVIEPEPVAEIKVKPTEPIDSQKVITQTNLTVAPAEIPKPTTAIDTTVATIKENPVATNEPIKGPPQYAADKSSVAPAEIPKPKTAVDTAVATIKENPVATNEPIKGPPQYAADKPNVAPAEVPKPTTAIDTTVAKVKENPIATNEPIKGLPQYAADRPNVAPAEVPKPKTAIDTTVATIKENPIATNEPIKGPPQYVTGKPIGHPTVEPKGYSKPGTTTDGDITVLTTISEEGKTPEIIPFPSKRTTAASISVEDTTNAFNIVRNNYTISSVYFETKKTLYKPESFVILDHLAQILLDNPTYTLVIKGHTDITGTTQGNQLLSINRAKTCYSHLIKRGVPAKRMSFKGFGSSLPIADNKTETARQQNRRVEFVIITD